MTQTSIIPPGPQAFICREMSAETMKIPLPIIDPTTREMAWTGPMPVTKSDLVSWLMGSQVRRGAEGRPTRPSASVIELELGMPRSRAAYYGMYWGHVSRRLKPPLGDAP